MPKMIVFCADGTWNGPPNQTGQSATDGSDDYGEVLKGNITNVAKLFANLAGHITAETLALQKEQEKLLADGNGNPTQIAKYLHGVGDSSNVIVKLLGGAFGMGVIARIVRGFTFISRNYAAGDNIVILGFSRGAYTARALAGMIANVGLLNPASYDSSDKLHSYALGVSAWARAKTVSLQGAGKLGGLATAFLDFVEGIVGATLPPDGLIPGVRMKCVAVWDTVGSMGIPVYAADRRIDLFRFVDTRLSAKVDCGFHTMAADELRIDFPVTRWDSDPRIRQAWFVGAHADVGGGYPYVESRLSDIALQWMINGLTGVGLQFAAPPPYQPVAQVMNQAVHAPWNDPPFDLGDQSPRSVLPDDTIHRSLADRWMGDAAYQPASMKTFPKPGLGTLQIDQSAWP